jgi:predicted RNA-binding protein with PIN domain
MTTLVVDGYNAINAIHFTKKELGKSLLSARRAILVISKEYARSSGYITNVSVVFDGRTKYRDMEKKDMLRDKAQIFSKTDQGDDKIIETVRLASKKGRVVVASNDNYVRNNSRAYGASILNVEELEKKQKKPLNISEKNLKGKIKNDITREYKKMLGL